MKINEEISFNVFKHEQSDDRQIGLCSDMKIIWATVLSLIKILKINLILAHPLSLQGKGFPMNDRVLKLFDDVYGLSVRR
jgi:hypothetical protein